MRILHISDLHFGAQDVSLQSDLEARVEKLRPDVVVATGDLVDTPRSRSFSSVRRFLEGLSKHCASANGSPPLLTVPGNHDVRDWGVFGQRPGKYRKAFAGIPSSHFFSEHNVWIYGFDSCGKGRVGANGFVRQRDLVHFARAFQELEEEHRASFHQAFKIVVLHHHPLPVKYDPELQRWLSLQNAGEFLAEMLKNDVSLVLHGHEHVEATSTYWRDVKGASKWGLPVVSVGSALKRGTDHWFHVINVEDDGEVRVDAYGESGATFDREPRTSSILPSLRGRLFEQWAKSEGHVCRMVTSVTILHPDGDAHRIVEYEGLRILDESVERATCHPITITTTSGYVDLPSLVRLGEGQPVGARLEIDEARSTDTRVRGTIQYGARLSNAECVSYAYNWWGVNAYAMNTRELALKHENDVPPVEFTYYEVDSPIEELLLLLKLPTNYRPGQRPRIFVARSDDRTRLEDWDRDRAIEMALDEDNAFHYVDSLKIATLRVVRPRKGFCYGIQWRLPPHAAEAESAEVSEIRSRLAALSEMTAESRTSIETLLASIADVLRANLIGGWSGELDISLAVFDESGTRIVIPAAINSGPGATVSLDYSSVSFEYGEGIAGKVLKTNEYRLYVQVPSQGRTTPDFYRQAPGGPSHKVLLGMPLQDPGHEDQVYAVLSFGSESLDCPLRKFESPTEPDRDRLGEFQNAINEFCLGFLTKAWKV